jgi:hypothetical protein
MLKSTSNAPAATRKGIPGPIHNITYSQRASTVTSTRPINKGKDVRTIQGLLRHAKASTSLDLYSQTIDASKMEAQKDIALAITSNQVEAN